MRLGYKYFRNSLIMLMILSVAFPFILWDFFTGKDTKSDPEAIYLLIFIWIAGTAFLVWQMVRAKRREQDATPSSQHSLPSISYATAYFVLPRYAFKDCDKLVAMFTDTPTSAGPFFYVMGCQVLKTEPVHEDARRFQARHGELDDAHDYFVLEYPPPPPFDLGDSDPTRLPPEQMPVLAPHFSVVVRHRQTRVVNYYTLGQSPIGGGTTFRSVTPDGMNCNLGPGPEPALNAFLDRLRRVDEI